MPLGQARRRECIAAIAGYGGTVQVNFDYMLVLPSVMI